MRKNIFPGNMLVLLKHDGQDLKVTGELGMPHGLGGYRHSSQCGKSLF